MLVVERLQKISSILADLYQRPDQTVDEYLKTDLYTAKDFSANKCKHLEKSDGLCR